MVHCDWDVAQSHLTAWTFEDIVDVDVLAVCQCFSILLPASLSHRLYLFHQLVNSAEFLHYKEYDSLAL